eukprot:NODE_45_length_32908_cov_0.790271.p15 type:complete len:283 gc:universal NODE_45_length_32908_cov_0.790271:27894-27046(-)
MMFITVIFAMLSMNPSSILKNHHDYLLSCENILMGNLRFHTHKHGEHHLCDLDIPLPKNIHFIQLIGQGDNGKVIKVRQNGQIYAFKYNLMNPYLTSNPSDTIYHEYFVGQMALTYDLVHHVKSFEFYPKLKSVSDSNVVQSGVLMEYCSGSLNAYSGEHSNEYIKDYAIQVLNGLHELQIHYLYHNDLQLQNIVNCDGIYKFIDNSATMKQGNELLIEIQGNLKRIGGSLLELKYGRDYVQWDFINQEYGKGNDAFIDFAMGLWRGTLNRVADAQNHEFLK